MFLLETATYSLENMINCNCNYEKFYIILDTKLLLGCFKMSTVSISAMSHRLNNFVTVCRNMKTLKTLRLNGFLHYITTGKAALFDSRTHTFPKYLIGIERQHD